VNGAGDGIDLKGRVVAIVGGDEREQEMARLAAGAGATVRAYGFPWPEGGITGVTACGSAPQAMEGADYALFPIPGMAADGSLYAPDAPGPIVPDAELLGHLAPSAAIVLGRADDGLRQAAGRLGVTLYEYEDDTELMLMRAPAIVEGVVALAVSHTDVSIHSSTVGVVGYGNIGSVLARTLVCLGAAVHVFARNPVQRAGAHVAGCRAHALGELPGLAPDLAMVFSTVPAPVVAGPVLEALAPGTLVVDIAAPPGGVDLAAARALGHRALWARGMGKSAPVTVGRSQWTGVQRRIAEHERRKGAHES
jgi:dipicolinate synthase subunit A